MTDTADFAARIRARYPEGLTGLFAIGGTRTAYILERRRDKADPGKIVDFADYAQYTLSGYLRLVGDFYALGGQNLIIPPLSYQAFYERGPEYTQTIVDHSLLLISDEAVRFYHEYEADPYFVGVDTLLHLPDAQPEHGLGARLDAFQQAWSYNDTRRKIIWEIAPIPLYSFWHAQHTMPIEEQQDLADALDMTTDMRVMYQTLFDYYARAALGTSIPVPDFYVGTNRNGDLKLRSVTPVSLLAGGPFRMFYLPYPSLFMTRNVLRTILDDLAFGGRLEAAMRYDYTGDFSSAQVQAEYDRIAQLVADPGTIAGLKRPRTRAESGTQGRA